MQPLTESGIDQVNEALARSAAAFDLWSGYPPEGRQQCLEAVALALEAAESLLLELAAEETHLPAQRLRVELRRTLHQWRSYAGGALPLLHSLARFDPGPPSLRKKHIPLGPVAVFGASNFPFAYSAAGGDTASALAAGCTVVIKGHPAHPRTSEESVRVIRGALEGAGGPPDAVMHLTGASHELSRWLVTHPGIAAVGFTGSIRGGRQLWDWAAARPVPIPVFAEMGSTNPVVLLPCALAQQGEGIAASLAASITGSAGQFCTKPGLLIGLDDKFTEAFSKDLLRLLVEKEPEAMLHGGIWQSYVQGWEEVRNTEGVAVLHDRGQPWEEGMAPALLATTTAARFLQAPRLAEELFGPYSLLVLAADLDEIHAVIRSLGGQLTASIFAGAADRENEALLLPLLEKKAGRIIRNGVPTGVSVSPAMHHGGPYPAATDPRFTAVGTDALLRWLRPVTYQNFPDV